MKRVIILTLFISMFSILCSEDINKQNNISELDFPKYDEHANRIPLYERSLLFKDYRVNQPIKSLIRWTALLTLIDSYNIIGNIAWRDEDKDKNYISSDFYNISLVISPFIGLMKGIHATKEKSINDNFNIPLDKFGCELSVISDFKPGPKRSGAGTYLNYDCDIIGFDEIKVGIVKIDWSESFVFPYEGRELKIGFAAKNYYRYNKMISPYYGGGLGFSWGKIDGELSDEYDEPSEPNLKTYYPYIHGFAGVRLNLWEFFYIKAEYDMELSGIYTKVKDYGADVGSNILTFSVTIGTKVF